MEYLIAEYKTAEDTLDKGHRALQHEVKQFNDSNRYGPIYRLSIPGKEERGYYFEFYCKNCDAKIYGKFRYSYWEVKCASAGHSPSECKEFRDFYFKYIDEYQFGEKHKCEEACEKAMEITQCPICGAQLSREIGYFLPPYIYGTEYEWDRKEVREELEERFGEDIDTDEGMALLRESIDRAQAKEEVVAYAKSCDLFMAENAQTKVSEIKENSDQLKKYILHLIHLENNIYALEQHLSELHYQRVCNNRSVVLSVHEPAYMIKAELEELRAAYQKTAEAIGDAKAYQPDVSVAYPAEPTAPVLGKPGLFNKKKVLAENEALTAKYQAEMDTYRKEVQRCDDEKARLIAEKRAAVLTEAQEKADAVKADLDEAERSMADKIKALEARPVPAKAIKNVLDKEIAEAEELLKKTFAARNELYACEVIFGKYRNAVALSSFYEYLMSGRCTSLEGADGAYNIYESEIRANRVIAQLDTVISSLEDIKQNQYMMYEELCNINASLESLNRTMGKALTSIQSIEANTTSMNEYMEHISQNSDVIAHNTAVTAHYSKVNVQLTNALGYMVALS